MSSLSDNPIEVKSRVINRWLRRHTNYQVRIELFSLYGCLRLEILKDNYVLFFDLGDTLEHRLDTVIQFFGLEVKD